MMNPKKVDTFGRVTALVLIVGFLGLAYQQTIRPLLAARKDLGAFKEAVQILSDAEGNVDRLNWEIDLVGAKIYNGSFTYYNENNRDTFLFKGISLNSDVLQASGNTDTLILKDFMVSGLLRVKG